MKAATAGVSYEISDVEWTGSASRLATLNQTPRAPATFISYTPLPSIAGGAPSGGFTCTGLDKITSGTYAGCWLVGSDGRTTDASPGSFNAEVLIMSPDFRTILVKFTLGVALTSVQGVTFNKATGNSFWAALTNDLTIRHYYLSGVNAGTEIVADRITWVHGGDGPTGLAYVQGSNALWVSDPASSTVRLLSCVGGGVLTSFTITLANRDQLHFDETNGLLYFSVGANGADGYAYVVDINNTALGAQIAYGPIKYFQAPEGLYIDRETGIATFLSDGGFHLIAIPTLNIAIFCKVALLAA
ncbi:MAG: hypothetical protein E5V25_20885 [Mesorhizobium sp.]|nr:MAG: hypothetical protein E5V25_20885 [Mesorhizobium sp.]